MIGYLYITIRNWIWAIPMILINTTFQRAIYIFHTFRDNIADIFYNPFRKCNSLVSCMRINLNFPVCNTSKNFSRFI